MSSLKDAQHVLESGQSGKWGQVIDVVENKDRTGLGFAPGAVRRDLKYFQEVFHSAGFIHDKDHSTAAILEDDQGDEIPFFEEYGSDYSIHMEDWEPYPEDPGYMSPEDAYVPFYSPRRREYIPWSDDETPEVDAILEDEGIEVPNFMTPGLVCQNWIVVDVPTIVHASK